jgi:hypothetical protein
MTVLLLISSVALVATCEVVELMVDTVVGDFGTTLFLVTFGLLPFKSFRGGSGTIRRVADEFARVPFATSGGLIFGGGGRIRCCCFGGAICTFLELDEDGVKTPCNPVTFENVFRIDRNATFRVFLLLLLYIVRFLGIIV